MTFSTGFGSGAVQTAMISAVDDIDVEGDHDFTVSIQSPTSPPATVGSPSSMTATIMDNDRKFDLRLEYLLLFTGILVVSIYSCWCCNSNANGNSFCD